MKERILHFEVRTPDRQKIFAHDTLWFASENEALEELNKSHAKFNIGNEIDKWMLIKVTGKEETDNEGNFQRETQIHTFDRYITFDKSKNAYIME